jgi:hypothetical protein
MLFGMPNSKRVFVGLGGLQCVSRVLKTTLNCLLWLAIVCSAEQQFFCCAAVHHHGLMQLSINICLSPQEEGVHTIEALSPEAAREFATLLCFVLVSPGGGHAFTSAYDFGPWPLLAGVKDLQPHVLEVGSSSACYEELHQQAAVDHQVFVSNAATMSLHSTMCWNGNFLHGVLNATPYAQVLRDTRALMLNGFVLDELPGPLVVAAALQTRAAGGSVFFDPGASPTDQRAVSLGS